MKQGVVKLRGIDRVNSRMKVRLSELKGKSMIGMLEAVKFIHDRTEKVPPRVPVDTGNLRHSWFVERMINEKGEPAVIFGFSANYAVYVHEMTYAETGKKVNWGRHGSGPKYLESHIKREEQTILNIIANSAKI